MLLQVQEASEHNGARSEERAPQARAMPMNAYLLPDRLVVHVDLLDADPETVSVALDGTS